jgi:hypothetical protein
VAFAPLAIGVGVLAAVVLDRDPGAKGGLAPTAALGQPPIPSDATAELPGSTLTARAMGKALRVDTSFVGEPSTEQVRIPR